MSYTMIEPPFELDIREMSKKELRRYYQWFMDVMPERIRILAGAVNNTPGFESWRPDFTPGSLDQLGEWFAGQVETEERSPKEIREMQKEMSPLEAPTIKLTHKTYSMIMDVGMYLGQVMARTYPVLKWDQPLGSKRFVDYGRPVLIGFGRVPFNPIRLVCVIAYGLVSNHVTGRRLREIHDIWSRTIDPIP